MASPFKHTAKQARKEEKARIIHSALLEEMRRMSDLETQPTNTIAQATSPENKDSASPYPKLTHIMLPVKTGRG